jgi:hypothetical protein
MPKRRATLLVLSIVGGILCAFSSRAAYRTQIDGEFEGCEYDKVYPLLDGTLLVCHEFKYVYSFSPEVIVIDGHRVLINNEVF